MEKKEESRDIKGECRSLFMSGNWTGKKKKKRNEETKGKGGYWRVVETIFFFQRQVCIRLLLLATISFGLVKNQKSILDRQKRKSSWVRSVATKYNRRLYFERSAYTLAAQPPGKVFCSWIFHLFFISPPFSLSPSLSSELAIVGKNAPLFVDIVDFRVTRAPSLSTLSRPLFHATLCSASPHLLATLLGTMNPQDSV